MPRKRLGRYVLGKCIGKGFSGKVFRCVEDQSGREFAVKMPQQSQRLRREIAVMKKLNHPNVVLQTGNNMYLVMELVDGGDLFSRIVAGVAHCHEQGIAHRDLKLENVLLDRNDTAKVADFGLSTMLSGDRLVMTVCGTPNYVAPEVLREVPYDPMAVDAWSLGVLLFALLAGELPFDEEDPRLLQSRICKGDYTIPSRFSGAASDLVSRSLVITPECRWTVRGEKNSIMSHQWFRVDWVSPAPTAVEQIPVSREEEDAAVLDTPEPTSS